MRRWMLAIALLTALPGLAQAQQVVVTPVERPGVELSLQGDLGAWFPTNTAFADVGFAYGVRAGLLLAPWLGIEAHYLGTSRINDFEVVPGTTRFDSITGNVKLMARSGIGRTASLTPYATAGAGAYAFSSPAAGPGAAVSPRARLDIPLGVGLLLDLGPNVSLGAEGKYHILFGDQDPAGGLEQAATDAISLLGTLNFRI